MPIMTIYAIPNEEGPLHNIILRPTSYHKEEALGLKNIISLSWLYEFSDQDPKFLVESLKNKFATLSNRWSGRKSEKC